MTPFPLPDLCGKFPAFVCREAEKTALVGCELAQEVYPGLAVLLYGDLGAGKTFLLRALGEALGAGRMKSPTFTVEAVHRLPGRSYPFVHADLYRLDGAADSSSLMLDERIEEGAILAVEWAELWKSPPVVDRWDIRLSIAGEEVRILELAAFGERALGAMSRVCERLFGVCR